MWWRGMAIVPVGMCVGAMCGIVAFWLFNDIAAATCAFVPPVAFAVVIAVKATT